MARNKFVLTSDLVKVEPEPLEVSSPTREDDVAVVEEPVLTPPLPTFVEEERKHPDDEKDQLNLKITKRVKKDFQIWCIQNNKTMSDVVEEMMKECLSD
jgi:hypothetical protein